MTTEILGFNAKEAKELAKQNNRTMVNTSLELRAALQECQRVAECGGRFAHIKQRVVDAECPPDLRAVAQALTDRGFTVEGCWAPNWHLLVRW